MIRSTAATETVRRSAMSSTGTSTATYSRSHSSGTRTSELPRQSEVVLPEHPDVRDAVAKHRDPLEAEPEGEPRDVLGVVADVHEHVRVDESGAAHLDPARVLARRAAGPVADEARDRRLERRLGEREEVCAEAHLHIPAEEGEGEGEQRPLEVGDRDTAVDGQALDLVEE